MNGPMIEASVGVLLSAFLLRLWMARAARRALAVDQWFWKAYVETARGQSSFPPELPQYRLDEAQWYPPLFPWLLVRLPRAVFERWAAWVSIGLDLVRLGLLLGAAAAWGEGRPGVILAAGALYATTPVLVLYNVQLNPRALGALLLDIAGLATLWGLGPGGPPWAWGAAVVAGSLVLLTHKMTAQLLGFLCLFGAGAAGEWRVLGLAPAAVLLALALSGGFYLKVLRAHADIVGFWNRNWRWLQADPIRESPVYGEPGYLSPTRLHQSGLPGLIRHGRSLLRLYPGGWIGWGLAASVVADGSAAGLLVWSLAGTLFALVTTFLPYLKCLGAGSLYLYNVAFPQSLLLGLAIGGASPTLLGLVGLAAAVAANLASLSVSTLTLSSQRRALDDGWQELLRHLAVAPRGPVFCVPQNLYDELTYRTGQPVLFGGHGYGFRRLEPLFPRLTLSFRALRESHGLRYVVAREGCLTPQALADLPSPPKVFGGYRLFEWAER
jgi:hypothetical protein